MICLPQCLSDFYYILLFGRKFWLKTICNTEQNKIKEYNFFWDDNELILDYHIAKKMLIKNSITPLAKYNIKYSKSHAILNILQDLYITHFLFKILGKDFYEEKKHSNILI